MWCTRALVIVVLVSILSAWKGAEAQSQQCTNLPNATTSNVMNLVESPVIDFVITCAAISNEQPPIGLVYYRETVALVTYQLIDSPPVTRFVHSTCEGTTWISDEVYDEIVAPLPTNPEIVMAREDCSQCGPGPESDPETLCLPITDLRISVDGQSYSTFDSGLDESPIYIYDVNAGSSAQLNVSCMLVPPANSSVAVFFVLPEIEGLDPQTLTIMDSMEENITIIRNSTSSMESLSFQPRFIPELSGEYQCNTTSLSVDSPLSLLITTDNPYLVYNGANTSIVNGPTRFFILDGLKSEYRLPNGTQLDGSSELQVFYTDNGETVNGDIALVRSINSLSGIYNVSFMSDLPSVVDVTVSLDLTAAGLPATRAVSVLVQSVELTINAPDMLEVTEGDTVNVICSSSITELNPSLSWRKITDGTPGDICSENQTLLIPAVELADAVTYECFVNDITYQSIEGPLLRLFVYRSGSPILIRPSDQFTSFPFVSSNAVVNTNISSFPGVRVSVTCQGLVGNGQLRWILSDPEVSGPVPSQVGVVTSTGPRQLQLDISDTIAIFDFPFEFTCESMESGASTSFFLSDSNPLFEVITYPDQMLAISEKFVAQFLVAVNGNGVSNTEGFIFVVMVQDNFIPLQPEQNDSFVYNLQFYAASVLNNATIDVTVSSELGIVTRSLDVNVFAPSVSAPREIVTVVQGKEVTLSCDSSSPRATFTWFWISNSVRNPLPEQFFAFPNGESGNSTIQFTPYREDIRTFANIYPPVDLGLSSVIELNTMSMVQMSNEYFFCTLCDSPLLDNSCENENQGLFAMTTLLVQYHTITLSTPDFMLYNNSITNNHFPDYFQINCTWVDGHGQGYWRTDIPALEPYLAAGDFSAPLLISNFTITVKTSSTGTCITQMIDSEFVPEGLEFPEELLGNYYCHSGESGDFVTALVIRDSFGTTNTPQVVAPLGSSVFMPFKAAFNPFMEPIGGLQSSSDTFFFLQAQTPSSDIIFASELDGQVQRLMIFEVSPFNYGLYIDPLQSVDNGTYIISVAQSMDINISISLQVTVPTLVVFPDSITVMEGDSVTLTCTPDDPRVKVQWYYVSQPDIIGPDDEGTSEFSVPKALCPYRMDVMFDDQEFQHQLTIFTSRQLRFEEEIEPLGQGQYLCYPQGLSGNCNLGSGDPLESFESPGRVTVNVLESCWSDVAAGVLWDSAVEGETREESCRRFSTKFSSVLLARRYCLPGGIWSLVDFSGCTLSSNSIPPFLIITYLLITPDVPGLLDPFSQELLNFLNNNFTTLPVESVTLTSAFQTMELNGFFPFFEVPLNSMNNGVFIVFEVSLNSTSYNNLTEDRLIDAVLSPDQVFSTNLTVIGQNPYGFIANDVCACGILQNNFVIEEEITQIGQVLQRTCSEVSAHPCNCLTSDILSCECSRPFVGNHFNCTLDSDMDTYPDIAIQDPDCSETIPYCSADICPNLYDPSQTIFPCDIVTPVDGDGVVCVFETDTEWNIIWPETAAGIRSTQPCPRTPMQVTGLATRFCNESGDWLDVDVSDCQTEVIAILGQTVEGTYANIEVLSPQELVILVEEVPEILEELSIATSALATNNGSLFPSDLATTNSILASIIDLLANTPNSSVTVANVLVDVLNNILNIIHQPGWEDIQTMDSSVGSELLLDNTETFALLLASSLPENQTELSISRENIALRVMVIPVTPETRFETITFPEPADLVNFNDTFANAPPANISIPPYVLSNRAPGLNELPVANVLFNNLNNFLMSSNVTDTGQAATLILSSQVAVRRDDTMILSEPVVINFRIIEENVTFSSPRCVFWDFAGTIGEGLWSTSGINTVFIENTTEVRCESSHLTSFAVLVDVTGNQLPPAEALALLIVSYIGCAISIVCLLATIIFFLTFGKQLLTSVHNFVHLNLALSLLCAYIVFVSGLETAVGNRAACIAVAALMHYFFLAAFCWMLCEGIMLYLMLVVVFSRLSKKWWFFLLLGWLPPIVPLALALGLARDEYAQGIDFCWLSTSHGVIWAFVAPMLVIIVINTVFLVLVLISLVRNRGTKNVHKLEKHKRVDLVISIVKASVILLPLLGLTWVLGLFAINRNTSVFAWLFTISSSLQGLAIFFFHVIRNERIWNKLSCKKKSGSSAFTSSTSQPGSSASKGGHYGKYSAFTQPEKVELSSLNKIDEADVEKVPLDDDEKADLATTETFGKKSLGRERTIVSHTETLTFDQDYDAPPPSSVAAEKRSPVESSILHITPTHSLPQKKADDDATSATEDEKTYILKHETDNQ